MHRGNVITGNTFENIVSTEHPELGFPALNCVYLDDELSGTTISNNTFRNCYNGAMLGGGRDNVFRDNRFEQMANLAITFDSRGLSWQKESCTLDVRLLLAARPTRAPAR